MERGSEYVTAEEAIERLGISRATFYNHARRLVRFRRVGDRRVLYRATDIEQMAAPQPQVHQTTIDPPLIYKPKRRRKGSASPRAD